jgi:hypothetical protein
MVIMGDVVGINAVFGGILIITAILILNIAEGSKERISLDR